MQSEPCWLYSLVELAYRMETKVTTLIEGYAKETDGGWLASSSTVLIKDSGKNVIVDPGINRALLLKKLADAGLTVADIDVVFMTHYHPDHNFLTAIFEKALVLDGDMIYEGDKETPYKGKIPGTEIEVLPTPGHAHEHCSLLAHTDEGDVVVAADVFWWMDNEDQKVDDYATLVNRQDPFVKDEKALVESRKKVLQIADWIIPGHGKMFENPHKNH